MKERRAWFTFLSSNNYYLYLLLGLYKNLLDVKTKYPVYCGVTPEVNINTKNILKKVGLNIIELNTSIISQKVLSQVKSKNCDHYAAAFTKLTLLDLNIEQLFDKIVYIDTDVQVLKNIDDVFDYPHMAAIEDVAPSSNKIASPYTLGCSKFCSGMFVWDFKNNLGKGHDILIKLQNLDQKITWHDQNVLNYFYQDWRIHNELHIPPEYGLMNNAKNFSKIPFENIKAIHYTGRLKTDWPFTRPKDLDEREWKHKNLHFKEWVESIAMAINYFNKTYKLTIQVPNANNLRLITYKQYKEKKADGKDNCFLYF